MKRISIRATAMALALAAMPLLSACQPTPDGPVVADKRNAAMEEKISGSTASGKYQAEARWEETLDAGIPKTKLVFEADVITPDAEKIPVVMIDDSGFTQEEADKIIAYFSKGKDMFAPKDEMSKPEIQEMIMEQKRILAAIKERGEKEPGSSMTSVDENGVEKTYEQYTVEIDGQTYTDSPDWIEEYIADLEDMLKTAPDTVEDKPAETKLRKNAEMYPDMDENDAYAQSETIAIELRDKNNSTSKGNLYISNNNVNGQYQDSYVNYSLSLAKDDYASYEDYGLPEGRDWDTQPEGVKMTREEAEAMAKTMLEELDIEGLELYSLNKGFSYANEDDYKEGWCARFQRKVNGVPLTMESNTNTSIEINEENYRDHGYTDEDMERMKKDGEMGMHMTSGWSYENLYMSIDDNGIRNFQWNGRFKVTETVNDNVELIPFDEVKAAIKKNLPLKLAEWDLSGDTSIDSLEIKVHRVELGLMRTAIQDRPGEFRLIPVWDVFTTMKTNYNEDELRKQLKAYEAESKAYDPDFDIEEQIKEIMEYDAEASRGLGPEWSQLTINALDGSMIDRQKGY